jgi:hypothetical protein
MITWGQLAKSQTDPEKIEEAIQRLVAEHNANPEAHLVEGGSLQSHKMAEIIDHLVESVIADKIRDGEIDLKKLVADKYMLITCFESPDGWSSIDYYYGNVVFSMFETVIYTYAHNGAWAQLASEPSAAFPVVNFAKNPFFQTTICCQDNDNQEFYVTVGRRDLNAFGFKVLNNTLYAYWCRNSVPFTYEIEGVDITVYNVYRAVFDSEAGKIYFYVNGVLKYTATSNLPEGTSTFVIHYELNGSAARALTVYIRDLFFSCGR